MKQLIKRIYLSTDGIMWSKPKPNHQNSLFDYAFQIIEYYDKNGNLRYEKHYNSEGEYIHSIEQYCDPDEKGIVLPNPYVYYTTVDLVEVEATNLPCLKHIIVYNERRNRISAKTYYLPTHRLYQDISFTYKYDEQGEIIEIIESDWTNPDEGEPYTQYTKIEITINYI